MQPVAEVAEQRARAAADRLGHVARAAERCVDADERQHERDDTGSREHRASPAHRHRSQPQEQHRERGREHDQAAAVGAGLAPADRDERQSSERREPRQAPDDDCRDQRREHQRLELVPDAVEAGAAVRTRTEDCERIRFARERQDREIADQEEADAERDQPPARRPGEHKPHRQQEHGHDHDPEGRHAEKREQHRRGDRARASERAGRWGDRDEREDQQDGLDIRPAAIVVDPSQAPVEPAQVVGRVGIGARLCPRPKRGRGCALQPR